MVFVKIKYHILAFFQFIWLKVIYGKNLSIGSHTTWRRNFSVILSKKGQLSIGENCFFNNDCSIAADTKITIGDGCIFGESVKIYDSNHKFKKGIPFKEQGYSGGSVEIGRHCWIGSGVIILKGAKISDNCVVGAGCVVKGVIPEGSIVQRGEDNIITVIRD